METETSFPLFTADQLADFKQGLEQGSLMPKSLGLLQEQVAPTLGAPVPIPGHGEAGSYEHNTHKQNYRLIERAGLLYQLTNRACYAELTKNLLLGYADSYLSMGFHKQQNTNPPGRIFHQILNEQMWLLFAALGYSYVKEGLTEQESEKIKTQLFFPMLELFTETNRHDFDRIHNHGLWAVAAVGIAGIAIGRDDYVDLAIEGQARDRENGGFLAQISQLFSPSGYYVEGPYYQRFAIHPLCLFAQALHVHRPELAIYQYKDQVIKRSVTTLLATAYPNGEFPAFNDASRTMGIKDEALVTAVALVHHHYGHSDQLVEAARLQGQVCLHPCAQALARAADAQQQEPTREYKSPWPSTEFCEGPRGDRGAQGFLRALSKTGDCTQVTMNYGQHGLDHGHFDTLGITLFNRGQEMLREYGFGRWVNVEPKFGGRYLEENRSWARQSVAHNGVVVDQQCQNKGDQHQADAVHGIPHFFEAKTNIQAMSAFANDHYHGVRMQRSILLLCLENFEFPLMLDLYRLSSEQSHQYDYTLQYKGQIMDTNVAYTYHNNSRPVLGEQNGYQHLFEVARGKTPDCLRLTWLQGHSFYTWCNAVKSTEKSTVENNEGGGELIFAQLGANNPNFNLREEPCLLLRQSGKNLLFASAFETHGYFDEASERCEGARAKVTDIKILAHSEQGSVVQLTTEQSHTTVMVSNIPQVTPSTEHNITVGDKCFHWKGYFACREN